MAVRLVGFWRSDARPDLPDPAALVDPEWSGWERDELVYYLSGGSCGRAYMGYSICRICGERNGSGELTDGTYLWPEGLRHYVAEHNVRLPAEFVAHALERRKVIDEGPRDEAWWMENALPRP